MAKSRGNAISLGADEDDDRPPDPSGREPIRCATSPSTPSADRRCPSCCPSSGALTGRSPGEVAEEIGDGGSGALKALAVEVVNEHCWPLRRRRRGLLADPDHLDGVLLDGIAQANAMANDTLDRVRSAMGMDYLSTELTTAKGPGASRGPPSWGERRGSNPRPPGPQPGALPAELRPPWLGAPQSSGRRASLATRRVGPTGVRRRCGAGTRGGEPRRVAVSGPGCGTNTAAR